MSTVIWKNDLTALSPTPPPRMVTWLQRPVILSQALKRCGQLLNVEVVKEQFNPPYEDESFASSVSTSPAWIRQIFLKGGEVRWVYARVVVAGPTFARYRTQFTTLATQLLGETILYRYNEVQRTAFEYAQIKAPHPLWAELTLSLGESCFSSLIWGRRSLFTLAGYPLWVSEVFLPAIPHFVA